MEEGIWELRAGHRALARKWPRQLCLAAAQWVQREKAGYAGYCGPFWESFSCAPRTVRTESGVSLPIWGRATHCSLSSINESKERINKHTLSTFLEKAMAHRVGHDWSDLAAAAAARTFLGYLLLPWKNNHAGSVMSERPHGLQPVRLLCPWDFPGKNTGLGCHFLLQGILLTQGSNTGLLWLLHR